MTQNDKQQLLLKELCTRQPYGVILKTPQGDGYLNEVSLCIFGHKLGINIKATERTYFKLEECKPYLRPMSSMTEEERTEYLNACGNEMDNALSSPRYSGIDYLNSIHVDYRDLIPMGLAIEVTKENNPYKN